VSVDPRFTPRAPADVLSLIRAHPLAWIISRDFQATPLPLLAETDPSGKIVSLLGHFARRNPQVGALQGDPEALILFQGPQGYVSPRLVSNPTWGPTWNYAVVRFEVTINFVPDETDAAVRRLASYLEGAKVTAWQVEAMQGRYDELLKYIIAFRARVRAMRATFKLGQDENDATFGQIVTGLGGSELAQLMAAQRRTTGG
jgi:transcriptional regulator